MGSHQKEKMIISVFIFSPSSESNSCETRFLERCLVTKWINVFWIAVAQRPGRLQDHIRLTKPDLGLENEVT